MNLEFSWNSGCASNEGACGQAANGAAAGPNGYGAYGGYAPPQGGYAPSAAQNIHEIRNVITVAEKPFAQKKGLDLAIPTPAMVLLTCLQPGNNARLYDSLQNPSEIP